MTDRLAAAWDRNAEKWIAWARRPDHDSYERFHRDRFLDLVPDAGGDRCLVVDVGCGEGRVGRDLAAAGLDVVGVDASPTMVRSCLAHPDGCPALVGDAAHLPVAGGVADVVVAFLSLHDIADLDGAVHEAGRVLRPGGHLLMSIVHPINSAGSFADAGDRATDPFVIDGSYAGTSDFVDEVARDGLTMTFHGVHRPLGAYTGALRAAGFVIDAMDEVYDDDPESRWRRVPLFLHVLAHR